MPRRTVILVAMLALLTAGVAFGFAMVQRQFSEKGKRYLLRELSARGIETEIGDLHYDAFRGIVARDVRVFESRERRQVVASFGELVVDLDFGKMADDEAFVRSIDLRDGKLSFAAGVEGERLFLGGIEARVRIPEKAVEIPFLGFAFEGVDVNASGSILLDENAEGVIAEEKQTAVLEQLQDVVARLASEIRLLEFEGGKRPAAELNFVADMKAVDSVSARWKVAAPAGQRGVFGWKEASLHGRFEHRHFRIEELRLRDEFGQLVADADYGMGGDHVDFRLRSTIDLHGFLRSLFPAKILGEVAFATPPEFEGSGRFFLKGKKAERELPMAMTGRFGCEEFVSRKVPFLGLHADFSFDGERQYFRNILLDHESGSISGRLLLDGGDVRYAMAIDMDPTVIGSFFQNESTREILDLFAFGESPNVTIEFEGGGPTKMAEKWKTTGSFALGPFYYNAVGVQAAVGRFELNEKGQWFREFRIDRPEGALSGEEVMVDIESGLVRVKGLEGTLWPSGFASYFAPDIGEHLEVYRFDSPPKVRMDGIIDPVDGSDSDLDISFSTSKNGYYKLFGADLKLSAPSGEIHVKSGRAAVKVTAGMFGEGKARLDGDFGINEGDETFSLRYVLADGDFEELARTYQFETETKGNLGGHFSCRAPGKGRPLEGEGEVAIVEGNVFSIPLFGPLSRMLNAILPDSPTTKATYTVADKASATLTLSDGLLRTDDLEAFTPAFRLRVRGSVDVETQDVLFDAWMNFRRPLPRLVFLPVSRLLEYEANGTLADPEWRPTNFSFPQKIAERLGLKEERKDAEEEAGEGADVGNGGRKPIRPIRNMLGR